MPGTFIFLKHQLDLKQGTASFFYQLDHNNHTYNFVEKLSFEISNIVAEASEIRLKPFLDNLLLMLGISYWKTFCPTDIQTPTIELTKDQAIFWNTIYTKGLGEFFYKNNLDFKNLVQFPYVIASEQSERGDLKTQEIAASSARGETPRNDDKKGSLLLFGGGKDSIVSAELLKKNTKPFDLFIVNPTNVHLDTAEHVGAKIVTIKRSIDPQLFALNKQPDVYNGHVPATAIVDFIALFASELYGYTNIIASNEHSANYGNVHYLGEEINHQWSKTLEFEKLFQEYIAKNSTKSIHYFSLLRPLHEIKIVEEFIKYPKYFPYFSSCNNNFKLINTHQLLITHAWCGTCPKCLFVFILLSAFLSRETLLEIFNKNLYTDYKLLPYFRELVGLDISKPFECVGTPEETIVALWKAYKKSEYTNDVLMTYFTQEVLPTITNPEALESNLLKTQKEHTIPEEFVQLV